MSSLTDLDPTGVLSATTASVKLVTAALRVVPALKNATGQPSAGASPGGLQRSQTPSGATPIVHLDPERERRAYETVNYVLREFGGRLLAAGLVDGQALTNALTAATTHIEVKLFSGEANRLFESLAPKLGDPLLVNSVFTSIYFIGALTAELSSSLPNYKDSYTPIGPRIIQQLFRAAIGEDAFRENLTALLDAFKQLATTAGLLRPTDIGYSAFPGKSVKKVLFRTTLTSSQDSPPSLLAGIRAGPLAMYEAINPSMKKWSSISIAVDSPSQRHRVEVRSV